MLRFAICDDDIAYMQSIKQNICDAFDNAKTFDEKCECILYNTGEELIDKFIQDNIDIFFIDIECGAMSGFEIARQLVQKKKNPGIVYITNHKHYIYDAFVCRPLGFICKTNFVEDIRVPMMNIVDYLNENYRTIIVQKGRKDIALRMRNIVSVKVYAHKLEILFNENSNYGREEYTGQLSKHEPYLLKSGFIKISRETLVNRVYIEDIQGDVVTLINKEQLNISRRRVAEVTKIWRNGE